MDSDLQQAFNLAVENGINLFDTADSYGTGRLNGQSEKLLGKFIQEFPGWLFQLLHDANCNYHNFQDLCKIYEKILFVLTYGPFNESVIMRVKLSSGQLDQCGYCC